jgi:hypothetical protein
VGAGGNMKFTLLLIWGFFKSIPVVYPKFFKLQLLPFKWLFTFYKNYYVLLQGKMSRSDFKKVFEDFKDKETEDAPTEKAEPGLKPITTGSTSTVRVCVHKGCKGCDNRGTLCDSCEDFDNYESHNQS